MEYIYMYKIYIYTELITWHINTRHGNIMEYLLETWQYEIAPCIHESPCNPWNPCRPRGGVLKRCTWLRFQITWLVLSNHHSGNWNCNFASLLLTTCLNRRVLFRWNHMFLSEDILFVWSNMCTVQPGRCSTLTNNNNNINIIIIIVIMIIIIIITITITPYQLIKYTSRIRKSTDIACPKYSNLSTIPARRNVRVAANMLKLPCSFPVKSNTTFFAS